MHVKLKEVIVVEGKNDTNVLQSYLECDTIETHGTHIGKEVLKQIQEAQRTRGVIIFTDPDFPGEKIRTIINQSVSGCKHAFIEKEKAKTSKKVGVEHASKQDIIEALQHVMTYTDKLVETISHDEFIELGLTGLPDSSNKRQKIAVLLHLGKPNAKTLWKRLNMLQIHKEEIISLLKDNE